MSDRFEALQRLAAGLAGALTPDDVARATAEHSLPLVAARAGFVALATTDGTALEIVRSLGLHESAATGCRFGIDADVPSAEAVRRREPIYVHSAEERTRRYPSWRAGRWSEHGAWAAVPLAAGDKLIGAMLLCFAEAMAFDDEHRRLIETVATMAAQAMHRAVLFAAERQARARAEDAERRLWLLAEGSRLLSSSLDYLTTLQSVARLALPYLADWCAVDLYEDGELKRVALAHVSAAGERAGWELARRYPVSLDDRHGVARVFREHKPVLVERVTDEILAKVAHDAEHLALLRGLGIGSTIVVPIKVQERTLGVLSWSTRPSGRIYDAADLALAEEMGLRAALAIENARQHMLEQQARRDADRAVAAAQETDRRKDEFLAMLGHELRNPLAPIYTAVQLMKMRGRTDRELPIIERQVRHMARLVDDLMDVARVARGKIALHKEPLDLRAVVTRAMEMTSPLFDNKGHHVNLMLPEAAVSVDGDPVRLAQVVANLLTNAARYTPGGGHITVKLGVDGAQAVVAVSDDGIGISPTLLPSIFDLFVQGPRTLDRAEGGLGIGLTLVKSLVERHGGSVEARSGGSGMGSDFFVRLPLLTTTAEAAVVAAPPPDVADRSKRILVVDDNADALELLATILEDVGYTVLRAADAVEALRGIDAFDPHVALLDIGLPVMDGYELAARLRSRAKVPRLVAITGYGQDADRARSDRAGFAAHLTKPVDLELLISAIEG